MRAVVAALLLLLSVNLAFAGFGSYSRRVISSNLGACINGQQFERFYLISYKNYWQQDLSIACLNLDRTAQWVLIAHVACHERRSLIKKELCGSKRGVTVPKILTDEKLLDHLGDKPPYLMYYQLIGWGFGSNCHVNEDVTVGDANTGNEGLINLWACQSIKFGPEVQRHSRDGALDLFQVTTSGDLPLTGSPDGVPMFPSAFSTDTDPSWYNPE